MKEDVRVRWSHLEVMVCPAALLREVGRVWEGAGTDDGCPHWGEEERERGDIGAWEM